SRPEMRTIDQDEGADKAAADSRLRPAPFAPILRPRYWRRAREDGSMAAGRGGRQSSERSGLRPAFRRGLLGLALLLAAAILLPPAQAQTIQPALPDSAAPALPLPSVRLGDFDMMKRRRLIRILVPFSRTIYFLDKGAERGTAAEFGRQFEAWLNKKYKTKSLKIRIAFIPTPRDRLLSDLNAGLGDIVAASL